MEEGAWNAKQAEDQENERAVELVNVMAEAGPVNVTEEQGMSSARAAEEEKWSERAGPGALKEEGGTTIGRQVYVKEGPCRQNGKVDDLLTGREYGAWKERVD